MYCTLDQPHELEMLHQSDLKQRKRDLAAKKMLKARDQMHLTLKNIGELNRAEDKLLPPITKDRFGSYIPQNWYHLRIKQHERVAYLEDLYKRFRAITRKQKEYREI